MIADATPILIGCGQILQRGADPSTAMDPLGLMAESSRRAAADAGGGAALLRQLDKVAVVNIIGWQYANAPGLLAAALEAQPRQQLYTAVGGNTPQWLVNQTADEIAAGTTRLALIAGAEAIETLSNARKAGIRLEWTKGGEGEPTFVGDTRNGASSSEMQHGLVLPTSMYPLFENALRVHYGWSIAEHRRELGELCHRLTKIAAGNPYARFPQERSAHELATVTPKNRMIAFPYPKLMNAIMAVDQGAALLMTSVATARELGVPQSRWVYLHGAAEATDVWFPTERANFHSSPAIARCGREALAMAERSIDDIDLLDLYSCFPCAVQIGRDMLGIGRDDSRPLTVTGGLPYQGGPGNNYATHSIATMMDKLRDGSGRTGLVTALGWYLTKHAVGIYGIEPPPHTGRWRRPDPRTYQAELDASGHPRVAATGAGEAEIETYTVLHDRDGRPNRAVVVARRATGERVIADTPADVLLLESLMTAEGIGRRGELRPGDSGNVFAPY